MTVNHTRHKDKAVLFPATPFQFCNYHQVMQNLAGPTNWPTFHEFPKIILKMNFLSKVCQ